ncbi:MAG: hypothetical protein KDE27_01565 [Planctomycetes bacterium]|nr:hypothetical protein [Planctomycetota bacterium]
MNRSSLPFAALLAAAVLPSTPLRAQDVAWAWVSPVNQGATFTPSSAYRYTPSGAAITVARDPAQQNRFFVTFPGLNPVLGVRGVVHACAYGGNHTAVVNGWGGTGADVVATIETFTPTGGPANNAAFVVYYRRTGPDAQRSADLWADQPSTSSYAPSSAYAWNGSRPAPSIVRLGPGNYRVTLPQLGVTQSAERGNVQVTPYANDLMRARVVAWNANGADLEIDVATANAGGVATDGKFVLSYHEDAGPMDPEHGSGAHVLADQPTLTQYVPISQYTASNGTYGPRNAETITRLATGVYRVSLPSVVNTASARAIVSAYGTTPVHATVRYWQSDGHGGTNVVVDTFAPNGTPMDAGFSLDYLTDRPNHDVAWVKVEPSGQGSNWTPDRHFQYDSSGGPISVSRDIAVGGYLVSVPGVWPATGCITASALNGSHTAVVENVTTLGRTVRILVRTYGPSGTAIADRGFVLLYQRSGARDDRRAYLHANNPSSASYTPDTAQSWNGNRADPTITRTSAGVYRVVLPGLAPLGAELGHVQVTPAGGAMRRAKVASWGAIGSSMVATVLVSDASGTPFDGRFYLSYNEVAAPIPERQGSGSHVWANNATTAQYVPHVAYTDSNATLGPSNAERIDRLSTGYYQVHLPNVAPSDSSMAVVTAYGNSGDYAVVDNWQPATAGGTLVRVRCYDASGTPVLAQFTMLYLTDRPAVGTTASNSSYGTGCNGPVLTGTTRPILDTDWQMHLSGVPAGAVLGFVQLGFTNPGLAVGPQAPGCTIYTDAIVSALLPASSSIGYQIHVPSHVSFLGFAILAQGGAFVPGINPVGLTASNGLRGTIGDL